MVEEIKIRGGYKKTEVGVIPEDWEVESIAECCTKVTDGTHDTPNTVEKGVPYLTALHVKSNSIDFKNCYYVTQDTHENIYKRCNPEKNDVLMVNIGAGVATTALINVDYQFSLKNVALIKPDKNKILGSYLNYYQQYSKKKTIKTLSSGGAQPFLSLKQIGNLKIALPSLNEQKTISKALTDTDNLIYSIENLIDKKEKIKQGTMQELLTGKKRLDGFSGEWGIKDFNDIFIRYPTKRHQISTMNYLKSGSYPVIDQGKEKIIAYTDRKDKLFTSIEDGVIIFGDHTRALKYIDFKFVIGADGTQVIKTQDGNDMLPLW